MKPIMFAIPWYEYLVKDINEAVIALSSGDFDIGTVDHREFLDSERYYRLTQDVRGRHVIVVGSTGNLRSLFDLYCISSAAVDHGAAKLTMVCPFMGYSTMERSVKPGEAVTAKYVARMLSAIPHAGMGNSIVHMDLHADGLPFYYEGGLRCHHVYAQDVIEATALQLADGNPFVLASTDAGRAKWVEHLAQKMNVAPAFIIKRHIPGDDTEVRDISADVNGMHVILYDDMVRSGGSLVHAARAYLDKGASKVSAICTHGVLPGHSLTQIVCSRVLSALVVTNTHLSADNQSLQCEGFFSVVSVAGILARHLLDGLTREESTIQTKSS
jgi:ribose-phosphate pyrophosphokinase